MSNDSITIFETTNNGLNEGWTTFLKEVGCTVTATGGTAEIPPSNLTCTNQQFWDLQFSNDGNSKSFGKPVAKDGYILKDDSGADLFPAVYILGLSSSFIDPMPTFDEIITKFGVGDLWQKQPLTSAVITALLKTVTPLRFKIDRTEARNAVWLKTGMTKSVTVALAFKVDLSDSAPGDITQVVTDDLEFVGANGIPLATIPTPQFLVQRTSYGIKYLVGTKTKYRVWSTFRFSIKFPWNGFLFWITLDPSGVQCTMTMDPDPNRGETSDFWSRLDTFAGNGLSSGSCKPDFEGFMSHLSFQSVSIGKTADKKPWFEVKCIVKCSSNSSNQDPVDVFLTYNSLNSTFMGGLVLANHFPSDLDKILPEYNEGIGFQAPPDIDITKIPPAWDLKQLFSETATFPKGVPTAIGMAQVTFVKSVPKVFSFEASLVNISQTADHQVPVPFSWDGIVIQASKSSTFSCNAQATFTLTYKEYSPANLGLSLDYASSTGTWQVAGWAYDLNCGVLFGFFDKTYAAPLVDVLGKLTITSLNLLYTHSSTGAATSFFISGTITLGQVQLRMFFQYASSDAGSNTASKSALDADPTAPKQLTVSPLTNPPTKGSTVNTDWRFECDLGSVPEDGSATIGSIMNSIVDNSGDDLPDFVAQISIAAAKDRSPIQIKVGKNSKGQVIFDLRIIIMSISVFFMQVAGPLPDGTGHAPVKRILRVLVDKIPLIKEIPVIEHLPQPFDDLEYMWVNDNPDGGILESDVSAINDILDSSDAILYRKITKDNPKNVALVPGHHFTVISNGAVSLDHVFEIGKKPTAGNLIGAGGPGNTVGNEVIPSTPNPSSVSKGTVSKKLGPLSISSVSLEYKEKGGEKKLYITLDAIFTMGPIEFGLLGFGIALSLKGIHLNDLSPLLSQMSAQLAGLSLGFQKPPILLAGVFEHINAGGVETYMGGVGIGFPPYTFVAVGQYQILNKFKSVFIYAKLDGPLITLEFATISGVRLGFGYNSKVRSPTINQLTSFPFINDAGTSGAGNDPMKILASMTKSPSGDPVKDPAWVTAKEGEYWIAAGMTITAFDVLSITAVAMFAFKEAGLIISLFADAVAQMPPGVKDQREMVLYVEIGLVAEMNFMDAYFRVEASLAPTSFLLVPQCRLTGGFALVYWFGSNPHAGDFVFSIGGYHRRYTPPSWYPVPARLGISFTVGHNVSIIGQAYFAVTPKVAMGGALLHASLSIGPVNAWLDAAFDALINFHPLHYEADFRVSVGVKFNLDVWFVHIHISCSVGANLHIQGPEFGGYAYVDFYLFGFTVDFGASPQAAPPISLTSFWRMVHKPGPGTGVAAKSDSYPLEAKLTFDIDTVAQPAEALEAGAAFKFILEDGNFPQSKAATTPSAPVTGTAGASSDVNLASTGTGAKWFVKGGTFKFRVATTFAITEANVTSAPGDDASTDKLTSKASVYSQPMHVSDPITSVLTVTIRDSKEMIVSDWQDISFYTKAVPTGIWAVYNPNVDPSTLLNGKNATVSLPMGLLLTAPEPKLARSLIPPFSATAAAKFGVLDTRADPKRKQGTNWFLKPPEPMQTAYLAKALTAEEKAETQVQRWADFKSTWMGLQTKETAVMGTVKTDTAPATVGVIGLATSIFGWDTKRPETETSPRWQLNGKMPKRLIGNLGKMYLALPRVATV